MTTPGGLGNIPLPGTGTPVGGGGILSGIAGTLGGSNTLQTSIDALTRAVNTLSGIMGSMNNSGASGAGSGGRGPGGGFPSMVNPFGRNNVPGIGGGGPGGTGNIGRPATFGAGIATLASAAASYGNQQMPFQLGLNAYSTISQLGMNPSTGLTNGNALMKQAIGMGGQNYNVLANNGFDALQMTQQLQFLGGNPMFNRTALGRAGLGSAAGFGLTNPMLSGSQSAGLAQNLYSPGVSQNFIALGYGGSPRALGGGKPSNMGQVMQTILRGWFNKNSVSPGTLYQNLSQGGAGYYNLQALGLNPTQTAPVLEGYNQLFRRGLSANQAQSLFSEAARSGGQGQSARDRLSQLGVKTATSDIQAIRNAQSATTSRSADTANAFNSALSSSTKLLGAFNSAINKILDSTGLNNVLGGAGGIAGAFSSTNHATGTLASAGLTAMLVRLFTKGAGGAAAGGAASSAGGGILGRVLGGLGGGAASGAGGGLLSGLGGGALAGGIAAGGATIGGLGLLFNALRVRAKSTGWGGAFLESPQDLNRDPAFTGRFGPVFTKSQAAGTPDPSSRQQQGKGGKSSTSRGGGSAMAAIAAAESQLGVPYHFGMEKPGVGFDCSGLMQWAYKQAGVDIPRTSQMQWSSLSKRAVPMDQVQPGDLVFAAGSDGTASAPGHVGMMISNNRLIEAPHTGDNVKIVGYNPKAWSHAARPGRGGGLGLLPGNNTGNSSSTGLYGNAGADMGNYGSVNEVDIISAGGGGMMGGMTSVQQKGNISSGGSSGATGGFGGIPSNKRAIAAIARQIASSYGWGSGKNWDDFKKLENQEAGWRVDATNPTSGAYGLPQALPPDKMASAGKDWRTNPSTQLKWMFNYIKGRYGSPSGAWRHEQAVNWYGAGGHSGGGGLEIVGDRGPEVRLTGTGSTMLDNSQSMSLLKAISNQPAQTPWKNMMNAGTSGGKTIDPLKPSHANVVLNFRPGSIVIQAPKQGSDSSASGRQMASQFVKALANEDLYEAIAGGDK